MPLDGSHIKEVCHVLASYRERVAYIGLNNLFGRVVTSLLKQSPNINNLVLYDDKNGGAAKISNGAQQLCKVTTVVGREKLPMALSKADIVVIGDELFQKPSSESLTAIGQKAAEYAKLIAVFSPDAILVVAASPLNFVLPIIARVLDAAGCFNPKRLLGATSCDTLRASTLLSSRLRLGPQKTILPVIGGATATTRIPLFSQANSPVEIDKETKLDIIEKMKIFDGSNYSEADVIERAYASVRFTHSVLAARQGDKPIPEIAFTQNNEIPDVEYFSMPLLIGKDGVEKIMKLPKLSEFEDGMLNMAVDCLNADLEISKEIFEQLKKKTEVRSDYIQECGKTEGTKTEELDVKTKKHTDSLKEKGECFSKSGQWSKEEDVSYMDLEGAFMEDELITKKDGNDEGISKNAFNMKEVNDVTTTLVFPDRRNITKIRADSQDVIVSKDIEKTDPMQNLPSSPSEKLSKNISPPKSVNLKTGDIVSNIYGILNSPNKLKLGSAEVLSHEKENKPLLPSNSGVDHLPRPSTANDVDNFSFFENSIDRLLKTENKPKSPIKENKKPKNIYGSQRIIPNYFKRRSERENFPKFRKAIEIKIKSTGKKPHPFTLDHISELRHKKRSYIFTSDKNPKAYGIDVPVGFSKFLKSTEQPEDSSHEDKKETKPSDLSVSKTDTASESLKTVNTKVNTESEKLDKKYPLLDPFDKTLSQEKSESITINSTKLSISNNIENFPKSENLTNKVQITENNYQLSSQLPTTMIKISPLKFNAPTDKSTASDCKSDNLPGPEKLSSKKIVESLLEDTKPEKFLQPTAIIKADVSKTTANTAEVKVMEKAHTSLHEHTSKNINLSFNPIVQEGKHYQEVKSLDPKWKTDEPIKIKEKLLEIFTQELDQRSSVNFNTKFQLDTNAMDKKSQIQNNVGINEKSVIALDKNQNVEIVEKLSKDLTVKNQHTERVTRENLLVPDNKIKLIADKSESSLIKSGEIKNETNKLPETKQSELQNKVMIEASLTKPVERTTLDVANVEIVLGVPHKSLTTEVSQVYDTIKVEGEININPLGTWYENDKNAFNDQPSYFEKRLTTHTTDITGRKPKTLMRPSEDRKLKMIQIKNRRTSPNKEKLTTPENIKPLTDFSSHVAKLLANVENSAQQITPPSNSQRFPLTKKREELTTLPIHGHKQGSTHQPARLETKKPQPNIALSTSSYDKPSASSYDKQSSNVYDKQSISSYDKQRTNSYDKQSTSSYDKQSDSSYDKQSAGSCDKQTVSSYDKQHTNSYGKQSTSNYDKQSTGSCDKQTASSYDKQYTNSYGKQSTSSYDKQSDSSYDKQSSNIYDKQHTNSYGKQSTSSYDKQSDSSYDKQTSNIYDKQSANIYDKESTNSYENQNTNIYDKQCTSNYDKQCANSYNKISTNSYDKQNASNYDNQTIRNKIEAQNLDMPIGKPKDTVKSEISHSSLEMGMNEIDESVNVAPDENSKEDTQLNIPKRTISDIRKRRRINYPSDNEQKNSFVKREEKQKFLQSKNKEILNRLKASHKKKRNASKGQMSSVQEKANADSVKPYGFSLPVQTNLKQKWVSEKVTQPKKTANNVLQSNKTELQKKTIVFINDVDSPVVKSQHSSKPLELKQNKTNDENTDVKRKFRLPKVFNRLSSVVSPTVRNDTQPTTSGNKVKSELQQPVVSKVNNLNDQKLVQKVHTKTKLDPQTKVSTQTTTHGKTESVLSAKNNEDETIQINMEKDANKDKAQNQEICPVGTGTPFPDWTKINEDLIPYSSEFPSIVNLLKKNFEEMSSAKDLGLYIKEKAENPDIPKVKSQHANNSNKLLLNSGLENKKNVKKSLSDVELVKQTGTTDIKIEALKVTQKMPNNDSQRQNTILPTPKDKVCIQKTKISVTPSNTLITLDNKSFGPKASLNKMWEMKKNTVPSKKVKSTVVLRDDTPDMGHSNDIQSKPILINPVPTKGLKNVGNLSSKQNTIPTPKPWEKTRLNASNTIAPKKEQNDNKPKQTFLIQEAKTTVESKIKITPNKVIKRESLNEMSPRNKVLVNRGKAKEKSVSKPGKTEREKKSVGLGMSNVLVLTADDDKISNSRENNLLQILPKLEKEKIQMTESSPKMKKNFVELAQSSLLESLKNSAVLLNVKEASQEVFSKRKQIIENDVYKYTSGNQFFKGKPNEVGLQPQITKAGPELKLSPKLTDMLKGPERKTNTQQKTMSNEVNMFNKTASKSSEINVRVIHKSLEDHTNEDKKILPKLTEKKPQIEKRSTPRQIRRTRSQIVFQPNTQGQMSVHERESQDISRRRPLTINQKKISLYSEMSMANRNDVEVQIRKNSIPKEEEIHINNKPNAPSQVQTTQKKRNGSKRRRSSSQSYRRNHINTAQNKTRPNTAEIIPSQNKSPIVSNNISLDGSCPLSSPAKTWGRLFNVFKQIISRDLEEEQVERMKSLNKVLPTKNC